MPSNVRRHPRYGDIPLVPWTVTLANGRTQTGWQFDPDYRPELPEGAVRGDVRKQNCCQMCHVPRYFYQDEERACVQCRREFVFRAAEQKYWYEVLGFHFDSIPVRCPTCRRRRRSVLSLAEQVGRCRAALEDQPDDPALHLALARAIVERHESDGKGKLDEAVAASRQAARLWPEAREALLWEGLAQARAGRTAKARVALEAFLANARGAARGLAQKARTCLDELTPA